MTCDEIAALYDAAVEAAHAENIAKAKFQLALTTYLAEHKAPPGYGVDLFGDRQLKPIDKCTMRRVP